MENEIKKYVADGCGYVGQVEIGIYRNNKKYKMFSTNTGYYNLFYYLCECLAGGLNPKYQVDIAERPGKLQLLDSANKSILSYDISLTDLTITGDSSLGNSATPCSIIFDFLVPGTIIFGKEIWSANLVSMKDTTKIFASTPFVSPITVSDIDTNIYVSWKLTIGNGEIKNNP